LLNLQDFLIITNKTLRKSYKFARKKRGPQLQKYRINERIKVERVMLIDETGTAHGDMPTEKALELAQERGYDLVEVGPKANPPVVKLLDYGQIKYQQEKQLRKQKSAQKKIEVKGIRLSFNIGQHDSETRMKQTRKFLDKGQKVKLEMILRGRENRHIDLAKKQVKEFADALDVEFEVEQDIKKQGNKISMIIMPSTTN
jgi:translation initiation factor IF-3